MLNMIRKADRHCHPGLVFGVFFAVAGCATTHAHESSNVFAEIRGDFDFDKVADVAFLEGPVDGKAQLVAELSSQGRVVVESTAYSPDMRLSTAPPNVYTRACAKGSGADCGEVGNAITTSGEGIILRYPEKSSHLYYWDGQAFTKENLTD